MRNTVYDIIHALESEGYLVYEDGNVLNVQVPDGKSRLKRIEPYILNDIYEIASMYDAVTVYKDSISDAIVEVGEARGARGVYN